VAKTTKVKWALGSDEPEDLADFKDNEQLVKEHGGSLPSKGIYTFAIRRITSKPNKNDDERLSIGLSIQEPAKSKNADWNGYWVWDGMNVTEQGARWIKRWLKSMGLEWSDFIEKTKMDDQDPPHIVQIGRVKFESGKDVLVRAMIKISPPDDYNDSDYVEVARYLPADDGEGGATEDADDGVGDDDVVSMADDDAPSEDAADDAEEALREELADEKVAGLRQRALRNDNEADVAGVKKADLIDLIVEQEMSDDDSDGTVTMADIEELTDEELADRAIENGRKKKKVAKADRDDLLTWIQEDEDIPPF
jgi:hypothetical protein